MKQMFFQGVYKGTSIMQWINSQFVKHLCRCYTGCNDQSNGLNKDAAYKKTNECSVCD